MSIVYVFLMFFNCINILGTLYSIFKFTQRIILLIFKGEKKIENVRKQIKISKHILKISYRGMHAKLAKKLKYR